MYFKALRPLFISYSEPVCLLPESYFSMEARFVKSVIEKFFECIFQKTGAILPCPPVFIVFCGKNRAYLRSKGRQGKLFPLGAEGVFREFSGGIVGNEPDDPVGAIF